MPGRVAAATHALRRGPTALALCVALSATACGSGERTYEADEFVEAANAEGAALSLGDSLTSDDGGNDVRALTLSEDQDPPDRSPPPGDQHAHGGGSLTVTESAAEAREEYQRCEGAVSLLCYRAANVVAIFEGLTPAERRRLDSAFSALAGD